MTGKIIDLGQKRNFYESLDWKMREPEIRLGIYIRFYEELRKLTEDGWILEKDEIQVNNIIDNLQFLIEKDEKRKEQLEFLIEKRNRHSGKVINSPKLNGGDN